jgi:hypothetical protein
MHIENSMENLLYPLMMKLRTRRDHLRQGSPTIFFPIWRQPLLWVGSHNITRGNHGKLYSKRPELLCNY